MLNLKNYSERVALEDSLYEAIERKTEVTAIIQAFKEKKFKLSILDERIELWNIDVETTPSSSFEIQDTTIISEMLDADIILHDCVDITWCKNNMIYVTGGDCYLAAVMQNREDLVSLFQSHGWKFQITRYSTKDIDSLPMNREEAVLISGNKQWIYEIMGKENAFSHLRSIEYMEKESDQSRYILIDRYPASLYLQDEEVSNWLLAINPELASELQLEECLRWGNSVFLKACLDRHVDAYYPYARYLFDNSFVFDSAYMMKANHQLYADVNSNWILKRHVACLDILNDVLPDNARYMLLDCADHAAKKANADYMLKPDENPLYQYCKEYDSSLDFMSDVLLEPWGNLDGWIEELEEMSESERDEMIPHLNDKKFLDEDGTVIADDYDIESKAYIQDILFPKKEEEL